MRKHRLSLFLQSFVRFMFVLCFLSILLFVSAGTIRFAGGWIALSALLVPVFASGLFFFFRNPDMLYKRVMHREQDLRQEKIVFQCAAVFALGFVAAGLTYRYSLASLPSFYYVIGIIAYALSLAVYCLAYSVNPFLSKAVIVQDKQFVVDKGVYGLLRHPFYLSTTLLYFALSTALNSLISFILFLLFIPLLNRRIALEEEYLRNELPGYKDYMIKVPYKLIPHIW